MKAKHKTAEVVPAGQTVTQLYGRFVRAHATMSADNSPSRKLPAKLKQSAFDRKVARCAALAAAIEEAPAFSIAEMLLKIKVAGWDIGIPHKTLDDLDNWQPDGFIASGGECFALASLRDDLRRLSLRAKLLRPDLDHFLTNILQA
jgi:hypothetical protein